MNMLFALQSSDSRAQDLRTKKREERADLRAESKEQRAEIQKRAHRVQRAESRLQRAESRDQRTEQITESRRQSREQRMIDTKASAIHIYLHVYTYTTCSSHLERIDLYMLKYLAENPITTCTAENMQTPIQRIRSASASGEKAAEL
jgi:ATPase subunit of ABC transporter with duplicated ATPase domains